MFVSVHAIGGSHMCSKYLQKWGKESVQKQRATQSGSWVCTNSDSLGLTQWFNAFKCESFLLFFIDYNWSSFRFHRMICKKCVFENWFRRSFGGMLFIDSNCIYTQTFQDLMQREKQKLLLTQFSFDLIKWNSFSFLCGVCMDFVILLAKVFIDVFFRLCETNYQLHFHYHFATTKKR